MSQDFSDLEYDIIDLLNVAFPIFIQQQQYQRILEKLLNPDYLRCESRASALKGFFKNQIDAALETNNEALKSAAETLKSYDDRKFWNIIENACSYPVLKPLFAKVANLNIDPLISNLGPIVIAWTKSDDIPESAANITLASNSSSLAASYVIVLPTSFPKAAKNISITVPEGVSSLPSEGITIIASATNAIHQQAGTVQLIIPDSCKKFMTDAIIFDNVPPEVFAQNPFFTIKVPVDGNVVRIAMGNRDKKILQPLLRRK